MNRAFVASIAPKRLITAVVVLVVALALPTLVGANTTTSPDPTIGGGGDPDLELDAAGNPVLTHVRFGSGIMNFVRCNDPNCAGSNESIAGLGSESITSSMELDATGNPVIASYRPFPNFDLKIVHCNDPNCVGGNESTTLPDTDDTTGFMPSLALDASGRPVASYWNGALRVIHCGDANCSGPNSITTPDASPSVGRGSALALDAAGNPIVAYFDTINNDLKLLHCNDPDCAAGGDSIVVVDDDTTRSIFPFSAPSMQLDAAGNPVVAYASDENTDGQRIAHCDDANCTSAVINELPDGSSISMALDADGNPVIAFSDSTIKVLHCDDPDCDGTGESLESGEAGGYAPVLQLDADGDPVVAYGIGTNTGGGVTSLLRLMHCSNPNCTPDTSAPTTTVALTPDTPDGNNGWYVSAVSTSITADDGAGSGVAEIRCVLDPSTPPSSFDDLPSGPCTLSSVATDGSHTVYAAATDNVGNDGPLSSAGFMIDATPPTVTCDVDEPGPSFLLGASGASVGASVSDETSGPVAATVSEPAETSTVGNKAALLIGADQAGNAGGAFCPYRVAFNFLGFLSPIPQSSYKRGATIPVKFALANAAGAKLSDAAAQALISPVCRVKITLDDVEQPGCASYNAAIDIFQYDLKTSKTLSAGDHQLAIRVSAPDGSGVVNTNGLTIVIKA